MGNVERKRTTVNGQDITYGDSEISAKRGMGWKIVHLHRDNTTYYVDGQEATEEKIRRRGADQSAWEKVAHRTVKGSNLYNVVLQAILSSLRI